MAIGTTTGTAGAAALIGATAAASTAPPVAAASDTAMGVGAAIGGPSPQDFHPFLMHRASPRDRWSRALNRVRDWVDGQIHRSAPMVAASLPILIPNVGTLTVIASGLAAAALVKGGILAAAALPMMPQTVPAGEQGLSSLPTVRIQPEKYYLGITAHFAPDQAVLNPPTRTMKKWITRDAIVDMFAGYVLAAQQSDPEADDAILNHTFLFKTRCFISIYQGEKLRVTMNIATFANWFARHENIYAGIGTTIQRLREAVRARLAPEGLTAEAPPLPVEVVTPQGTPPDPLARLATSHPTLVQTLLTVVQREFRDQAIQRIVVDAVVRLSDLLSPEKIWERLGRAPHEQIGFFHEAVRTARLLEAGIPLTAVSREFPQDVVYEGWLMSQDGLYFAPQEKKDRVDADAVGQDGTVYELKWMNTGFGGEKGEFLDHFLTRQRFFHVDPSQQVSARVAMRLLNQVRKLGVAVQSGMIPRVEFHITSSKPLNPLVVELIQSTIPQVKIVVYPQLEAGVAEAMVVPDSAVQYWDRTVTASGRVQWQRRMVNAHQLHAQIAEVQHQYAALEGSIRGLEDYRTIEARVLDQLVQLNREVDTLTLAGLVDLELRWASLSGGVTRLSALNRMLNQINAHLRQNNRVIEADVRRMVQELKAQMNDYTGTDPAAALDDALGNADFLTGYLQLAETEPETMTVTERRAFLMGIALPLLQESLVTQDHVPSKQAFGIVNQFMDSLSDDRVRTMAPDAVMEEMDPGSPLSQALATEVKVHFGAFKTAHPELWQTVAPARATPPAMLAAKGHSDKDVGRFLIAALKEAGMTSGFSDWELRHTPDLRNFVILAVLKTMGGKLSAMATEPARSLSADLQKFANGLPGQTNAPFPIARKKTELFDLVRRYMTLTSEN